MSQLYLDSTQMLWLRRLRRERRNWLREFGIFGPLASVEGVSIFVFELVEGICRSQ